MRWRRATRADRVGAALADRHYSRQKVGSRQFVSPGRCVVLVSECERALWVVTWPLHVRHAWPGTWNNALFRNEGAGRSSDLIRSAIAETVAIFDEIPPAGLLTFIAPEHIAPTTNPGFCYKTVGFKRVGTTKVHRRHALLLSFDKILDIYLES